MSAIQPDAVSIPDAEATHGRESVTSGLLTGLIMLGVFLSAFLNPLDLVEDGGKMEVGLDYRVALKLAISGYCFLIALYGLSFIEQVRRSILSIPGALIVCLLVLAIPSALSGFSSAALPTVLINLTYVVFVPTALVHLGLNRFLWTVLLAILCLMLFAWFLYFFVPSYGVFPEKLPGGLIVYRLGGIAHPNSVGRLAALGLVATVFLLREKGIFNILFILMIAVLVSDIVGAQSRTAILGASAGMFAMFHKRLLSVAGLTVTMIGSLAMLVALLLVASNEGSSSFSLDRVVAKFTKSGEAEEITSGTGRVEIWMKSVDLIVEKPLTGHGFGAAPALLVDHSQSTHNSVLHAAMIAGLGGGLIMILLQIWLVAVLIMTENQFVRAASAFLIISGLVEDTILETFPGPASFFWFVCVLYPVCISAIDKRDEAVDSETVLNQ